MEQIGLNDAITNPELTYKQIEYNCCSFFGCGRQLTRQEALFGNRCIHHQKTKQDPIAKAIKSRISK